MERINFIILAANYVRVLILFELIFQTSEIQVVEIKFNQKPLLQ